MINVFFEDRDKKIIHIINHLFELQERSTTLNDVAKKVGLPTLIVKGILDTFQTMELSKCGIDIEVVGKKKVQYKIRGYSENRLQQLLVRKNPLFKLCEVLLNRSFKSLEHFANENYLSIATMYRKVKVLKELLDSYNLTLDFRRANYIGGKEHQIRHFFYELLYLGYGLTDEYSNVEWVKLMSYTEKIPFPVAQRIKILAYITEQRNKSNFFISEDTHFYSVHNSKFIEIEIIRICSLVLPEYLSNEQRKMEIDFFKMYMITLDVTSIHQFEMLSNLSMLTGNSYFDLIKKWIESLLQYFSISLSAKVYFFLVANLYYHLFRNEMIGGESQSYFNIDSKLNTGTSEFVLLYKKINEFLQMIHSLFPDSLANKEFYYMIIKEALLHSSKNVNICIFSGTAQTHKKMIEENIRKSSVVPVKFNDFISKRVDLIVSDSYFTSDKIAFEKKDAILFISRYPSIEEYSIIKEKVLHIYQKSIGVINE